MNTDRTYTSNTQRISRGTFFPNIVFKRTQRMLMLGIAVMVMLTVFVSCEDGGSIFDPPAQNIPTGEYRGPYMLSRSNPSDTSIRGTLYNEVSMALVINSTTRSYRIAPFDTSFLPASEGSYTLRYGRITLRDRSQRTFRDPSLVLSGEFTYTFDGTSLILSQKDSVRRREYSLILMRVF